MPPPSDHPSLTLSVLNDIFIVQQLTISEDIPDQLLSALTTLSSERNRFISITRTLEEISIVCNISSSSENDAQLPKWRCIKIKGPMDFGLTGIMCDITTPLKAAQIPVFTISTWNTDYILIAMDKLDQAVDTLKADGWIFGL